MTQLEIKRCKSCNAEIVWVHSSKTGTAQPLDAKPEKRIIIRGGTAYVVDTYMAHHVTCPYADQHRKERRHDSEPRAAHSAADVVP